ncbi:MAG: hypothetical protein LBJ00_08960 [Planctomycetaceae bacterium]|nr:hypothetical protein [Planctomycetaceae bacterium]
MHEFFYHKSDEVARRFLNILLRLPRPCGIYTVAGRAIGFALEQPCRVVALACSASGILKQLEFTFWKCNSYSSWRAL